jgi:hypothetical protein
MAQRQCGELFYSVAEERVAVYDERSDMPLGQGREGCVDFAVGAGNQDMKLQPEGARGASLAFLRAALPPSTPAPLGRAPMIVGYCGGAVSGIGMRVGWQPLIGRNGS